MKIMELLQDPDSFIDQIVEVEGFLNVLEHPGEIYLSFKDMDHSASVLISQDFWYFFEIISAVHPGISGIGNQSFTFSYPASIVGKFRKTGLSPFKYALDDISSVSMTIEYDSVATMLVDPDYYQFTAEIEYGHYPEHESHIRVKSIVTMPIKDSRVAIRLDTPRDFQELIGKVVTIPGRILGDLRTRAVNINDRQGVNIAIDFPDLVLMLRRCIESSTGFPMFPYDFEITGKLVRLLEEERRQQELGMIAMDEPILILQDLQEIVMKRVVFIFNDRY